MPGYPNDYFHFKSIRDPLYGFINLSKIETQIIDTPVFRRLHGIKQLSHAYLVYPTAIHTRFEHSLGVTYLADLVSKQLLFDDEVREIVRLAALLHDVGHGPFSHLFEEVIKNANGNQPKFEHIHEKISLMLIKEDPDISSILGDKSEKIIQILDHKPSSGLDKEISSLASDVVSSPLDVDKMDYLRRDSYHIGVAYGQFDLPRIIHTLTRTDDSIEQKICVDSKGKDAIENYRLGRYLMHAQVYKHHTRLVGDQMFLQALDLAVNEENVIPQKKLCLDPDLSKPHKEFLNFYTSLDDRGLYDYIFRKGEGKASKILRRIQHRDLLKRAGEYLIEKEIENVQIRNRISRLSKEDMRTMSQKIAEETNLDKHDVIVHSTNIPVNLYEGEIMIMWKEIPRKLDEFSPIDVHKSTINKFYVFGPKDDASRQRIREWMEKQLGITH